jgi:hypothetical protein
VPRLGGSASLAAGLLLFGGGLLLESVADWQKFQWKNDPGEVQAREGCNGTGGWDWVAEQQQHAQGHIWKCCLVRPA